MGTDLRELIGELYAEDDAGTPGVGSFCWAPVLYAHAAINAIRPISDDPAEANHTRYRVAKIQHHEIAIEGQAVAGHRFPDKTLNLGIGEELFVVPGKYRPVAVLFNPRAAIEAAVKDGLKPEKEMPLCLGCAPSYTLVDRAGNPRHKADFIENVRALKYGPFCYLPGHDKFRDREAFLRMDRLTWIPASLVRPTGVKLTAKGLEYVHSWYDSFAGVRELPEELATMRTLLLEEVDEQRNKLAARAAKSK